MLNLSNFAPDVLYAFPYRNVKPGTYVYHKHAFLELSTMLEGYSDYNVEGRWRRVNAGQALLFNPGVHHQETQPPHSQSLQLHIGFRGISLPGQSLDHLPFADALIELGPQKEAFMACARRIVSENERTGEVGHQLYVQALVVELLCMLLRALPVNEVQNDVPLTDAARGRADRDALVKAAMYYLEGHYKDELTLAELADRLHVSAAYLSRTFKALQGDSPINYLTNLRMQKARQLLRDEQLSVGEVASAVGYQDQYYFSKLFKRYFGAAPTLLDK